ncbi:ribokinase-like protein [Moesziomyces antarcticus]|uniref:Related to MAK32 protein n=2 Tax=Pseudozyma antarctica TaxID=84753 RepID=A0A5C3FN85_PSEA2|nr:ribokinase-like protein [Moesziomyces antarcticus]GAK64701.1 ribokinase-like protein [Moesziomyces antarcticus]SPO45686.1 related to MAK32 protein [Moesziomyces antarcticus]
MGDPAQPDASGSAVSGSAAPIQLATMGMFIIDTFRFIDPRTGQDLGNRGLEDQIGGGGCYFAIGARMWLPPGALQMVIDRGCDWKPEDQQVLDRYDQTAATTSAVGPPSMWHYRSRPDRTTRAVNIYTGEHRGFDYLSPKIRLEPSDLLACSPCAPPALPQWIHLICSPERALETIAQINAVLNAEKSPGARSASSFPKLVYEPIPDSCVFDNLDECLRVLPSLAVFSPNHEEAAALLGLSTEWEHICQQAAADPTGGTQSIIDFVTSKLAGGFVAHLQRTHAPPDGTAGEAFGPIMCIRSGAWGSVVGRAGLGFQHVPAWHSASARKAEAEGGLDCSPERIRDVTGAGNSFLGGFSAYLVQTESQSQLDPGTRMREAAMHGAVSASLVIEQLGLPHFDVVDGKKLWNGHTAAQRLELLRDRQTPAS